MVSTTSLLAAGALAFAANVDEVAAHSKMLLPVPVFNNPPEEFNTIGRLDEKQWTYPSSIATWDGAGLANDALKQSGAKTLRQFIMKYYKPTALATSKECGQTVLTGPRQPVPDTVDFPAGHPGPCEFWCDNYRIAFFEDCHKDNIKSVKVDKSKCSKASIVQGMYIGAHNQPWEIYINCAPIAGGTATDPSKVLDPNASGDGSGASANDDVDVAPTPAVNTSAPVSTPNAAPAASITSKPSTAAPTTAPAPVPVSPPVVPVPFVEMNSEESKCHSGSVGEPC